MPDVFLTPFKKIFPGTGTGLLACHLSTGNLTFEYKTPGDASVKVTNNNVTANEAGGLGAATNSLTWISTDGTNSVTSVFADFSVLRQSKIDPGSGPDIPAVIKRIDTNSITIIAGRSFVARMPAVIEFETEVTGGVHIQSIGGIDHIVAYRFSWLNDAIEKYIAVYDENLDQSLIVDMTFDKSINIFLYNQANGTDLKFPKYVNVTERDVNDVPTVFEKIGNLGSQNRILTTNSEGTKTLLFFTVDDSEGVSYNDYHIYELIDTETDFSLTKHSEFIKKTLAFHPDTHEIKTISGSKTILRQYTVTEDNCNDLGTYKYDQLTTMNSSFVEGIDLSYYTVTDWFVGASYNKYTGEVMVLTSKKLIGGEWIVSGIGAEHEVSEGTDGEIFNKTYDVNSYVEHDTTGVSRVGDAVFGDLNINDVELFVATIYNRTKTQRTDTVASGVNVTSNTPGWWRDDYKTTTFTSSSIASALTQLKIIDLSSLMFAYEIEVTTTATTVGSMSASKSTQTRLYCNGDDILIDESVEVVTPESIVLPGGADFTWEHIGTSGSGVTGCPNPSGGSTTTTYEPVHDII